MPIIYIIIALIVLVPALAPKKLKSKAIIISMLLMFVLFGLSLEMTQDWSGYYRRFYGENTGELQLESFYVFLMSICKPIGMLGFNIVCALFNLSVYYLYIRKVMPKNYAWIFFAVFMLRIMLGLTMIDTNRQTLAISFVLLGVYIQLFLKDFFKQKMVLYYISIFLCFLAAVNIHTSAFIALPIIVLSVICEKVKRWQLWVLFVLFLLTFVIDFKSLTSTFLSAVTLFSGDNADYFSQYSTELSLRSMSIPEQSIYGLLLFLFIYFYKYFSKEEKVLLLSSMLFITFQGYVMFTLARVLTYYRIFIPICLPFFSYTLIRRKLVNKYLVWGVIALVVAYCLYDFQKGIHMDLYNRWLDFKTVFDATEWY